MRKKNPGAKLLPGTCKKFLAAPLTLNYGCALQVPE